MCCCNPRVSAFTHEQTSHSAPDITRQRHSHLACVGVLLDDNNSTAARVPSSNNVCVIGWMPCCCCCCDCLNGITLFCILPTYYLVLWTVSLIPPPPPSRSLLSPRLAYVCLKRRLCTPMKTLQMATSFLICITFLRHCEICSGCVITQAKAWAQKPE